MTGRGGDTIIIDDPLKPDDAYSEAKRNQANERFKNTLLSRLDDKRAGAIVIVMQRELGVRSSPELEDDAQRVDAYPDHHEASSP